MPLNIDWQQILLHLLNFAILSGGLYFLLYQPVKAFMDQRQAHYREMAEQAQARTAQAEELYSQRKAQMDAVDDELRLRRAEAQRELQEALRLQQEQARQQAEKLLADARESACMEREKLLREADHELAALAAQAAEKMLHSAQGDPYDQFLQAAEGGGEHARP